VDADEVIAPTNQALAAAAPLDPSDMSQSVRLDQAASHEHSAGAHQITRPQRPALGGHSGELRAKNQSVRSLARLPFCDSSKLFATPKKCRPPTLMFSGVQRPVTACTFRQRLRTAKSLCIHR